MKKQSIHKSLLVAGILVCASVYPLTRIFPLPDLAMGLLTGIGIGLMILALIRRKSVTHRS